MSISSEFLTTYFQAQALGNSPTWVRLTALAEVIKAKLEAWRQASLFSLKVIARQAIKVKTAAASAKAGAPCCGLTQRQVQQCVVLGIHEV